MIRAVYAIRHQFAGVITETLYTQRPSDEQVEAVRRRFGAQGWARAVPLRLDVADASAQIGDYLDDYPEPEPAPAAPRGIPGLRFRATGVVTPPWND